MKAIQTCTIGDLNRETRDYLQGIWRRRGAEHPGIFLRRGRVGGSVAGCLAGLVLLAVAGLGLQPDSLYDSLDTQCLVAAIGVVCLAGSVHTLWLRFGGGSAGDFSYFDGSWYWDVGAHRLKVTDLRQVFGFQLVNHFTNGVRTKTVANLDLPKNERTSFTFTSQQNAQLFAQFLQTCQRIRGQAVMGQGRAMFTGELDGTTLTVALIELGPDGAPNPAAAQELRFTRTSRVATAAPAQAPAGPVVIAPAPGRTVPPAPGGRTAQEQQLRS